MSRRAMRFNALVTGLNRFRACLSCADSNHIFKCCDEYFPIAYLARVRSVSNCFNHSIQAGIIDGHLNFYFGQKVDTYSAPR